MDLAIFLSSVTLFALSMCFTPGPNNALALATGLDKGFRAALPHCFAVPVGSIVVLVLLALGLDQVFSRVPIFYEILRYAGAAYMVWLAWRISGLRFWSARSELGGKDGADKGREPSGDRQTKETPSDFAAAIEAKRQAGFTPLTFGQSFLLQFVNVKAWITNVVIISNYVGTGGQRWTRFWIVLLLMSVLAFASVATWAAGGSFMRRFLSSDGMRRCNYVFAAFLLVSVVLLFV